MKPEQPVSAPASAFQSVKDVEAHAKGRMDKVISGLQHEMASIRTGRASVAIFDNLRVDYYGTPTPLNQVANLHVPEPSLITILNPAYPGWWDTTEKHAMLDTFNGETDPGRRIDDWKKLQKLFFQQAPAIKVGEFYNLAARSARVAGYTTTPWPFFWNVRLG